MVGTYFSASEFPPVGLAPYYTPHPSTQTHTRGKYKLVLSSVWLRQGLDAEEYANKEQGAEAYVSPLKTWDAMLLWWWLLLFCWWCFGGSGSRRCCDGWLFWLPQCTKCTKFRQKQWFLYIVHINFILAYIRGTENSHVDHLCLQLIGWTSLCLGFSVCWVIMEILREQ